jgi:predicted choloylglycine hydrolase
MDMYSIPKKYNKEHKFFEKYLDNDVDKLSSFLQALYSKIENVELKGVTELNSEDKFTESKSISTIKWQEYNIFQFHHPAIWNLYRGISETVKEACEYYGVDFNKEQYMVQGWFNINDRKTGKLNWHDHGGPWAPFFHGYYCVKAEPSSTYYKINNDPDKIVENKNYDNRLIVSEMGHPHAMKDWDWDGPRITIAYDIMPLRHMNPMDLSQHYIPLL